MSIQETIVSNENIIINNNIILSAESNDIHCSSYTLNESQSAILRTNYSNQEDLCILFPAVFRILCSKYQFFNESLLCKNVISTKDSSNAIYNQINATSFDFPPITTTETTFKTVFNESKEVFINHSNIEEQLSKFNSWEVELLALNSESEVIELECTIQVEDVIRIVFKAPSGGNGSF